MLSSEVNLDSTVCGMMSAERNERANGSGLPPPSPNRRHGKDRARGGKRGAWTPRDLRHIGEKLDNCTRLQLVNLPAFRLGVPFPQTRNIINGRISSHYSVDKIPFAAKKLKIPKSNAQRGKSFVKKASSMFSRKSDKNDSANSSSASAKSPSEYTREDRERREKALQ
ncbi:hypothetical protein TNCV_3623241, partial [Trichonephila clavipes]